MSVTISNCHQICNSPTNNSQSKNLYTFSKSDRFPKRRRILCDKLYNPSQPTIQRTTSLGFGNKYDFTKDVPKSPPPTSYNLQSDFEYADQRGYGFGYSRDDMEITGPFATSRSNKNPGPGSYNNPSSLNKLFFSLRGKNCKQDKQKMKLPGPGVYPPAFPINEKGKYFLSKYKTNCVMNFNQLSSRTNLKDNKVPGPGSYKPLKIDLSNDGKYVPSKMKSSLVRKFGTSVRTNIARKSDTPGPGNYRLPSQFGHYVAKQSAKTPIASGKVGKEN